jgi:hypothetical protein
MLKNKTIKVFLFVTVFLFLSSLSLVLIPIVQAAGIDFEFFKEGGKDTGLVPCANDINNSSNGSIIKNPCTFNSALEMLNKLMSFALWVISFVLVGVIAYAGFKYILSKGSPSKVQESHKRFWAIVQGLIWMLCAWLLIYTIQSTLLNPEFYSSSSSIPVVKPDALTK